MVTCIARVVPGLTFLRWLFGKIRLNAIGPFVVPAVAFASLLGAVPTRLHAAGQTAGPTTESVYSGPVNINRPATLPAVADESGISNNPFTSPSDTVTQLQQQVAMPTFSPSGGSYSSAQALIINDPTSGATIRYTTDGSVPSQTNGTVYTDSFAISSPTTVRAIAFMSGDTDSDVASATYTIENGDRDCVTATARGAWQNNAMTSPTGVFTASFDATPSDSSSDSVIALSNGAQTDYASFACLVRFKFTGGIDAYNGTDYTADCNCPYSAGVSYHFRFVVNLPAQTYSVYVTPAGGSEQTIGLDYAFRVPATVLNNWGVFVNPTGIGSLSVCNFFTGNGRIHMIAASAGANGSIGPSGAVIVNQGASQFFAITPSSGYKVASVTVDGASVGPVTAYSFDNVQATHTISATFQPDVTTFTIMASAGAHGSISPSDAVNVNQGSSQSFAITSSSGYHVADVTVDGASVGPVTIYKFNDVQGSHTISATFQ
jgi:hypothetical protein